VGLTLNQNGIQASGEPGFSGVTVNLLAAMAQRCCHTQPTSRQVRFTNLAAGTYYVQFVAACRLLFTTKNASVRTIANDSNVNVSNGQDGCRTPHSRSDGNTIDAGLKVSTVAAAQRFVEESKL